MLVNATDRSNLILKSHLGIYGSLTGSFRKDIQYITAYGHLPNTMCFNDFIFPYLWSFIRLLENLIYIQFVSLIVCIFIQCFNFSEDICNWALFSLKLRNLRKKKLHNNEMIFCIKENIDGRIAINHLRILCAYSLTQTMEECMWTLTIQDLMNILCKRMEAVIVSVNK